MAILIEGERKIKLPEGNEDILMFESNVRRVIRWVEVLRQLNEEGFGDHQEFIDRIEGSLKFIERQSLVKTTSYDH